jgi:cytidine kinase
VALDLAVIGNLLVDDVVLSDGSTRMGEAGGATLYAVLGASLWGASTGIVSYRGDDYPEATLQALAARGVDLGGVHSLGGPGLRTWLLYEGRRRRMIHRLDCPSHAEASPGPERIPEAFHRARAVHIAPMPIEIQRSVVEFVSAGADTVLSLDPHLPISAATRSDWMAVLGGVDVLFLGEDELVEASDHPVPMLRGLIGGRLRTVVCKRGSRGGVVYDARTDQCFDWRARSNPVVDPTGAGDAFAGGFMAGWLAGDPVPEALNRAVVAASFAIEGWGASALLRATPAQAQARRRDWFGS